MTATQQAAVEEIFGGKREGSMEDVVLCTGQMVVSGSMLARKGFAALIQRVELKRGSENILVLATLAALVFSLYGRCVTYSFINYDDLNYINPIVRAGLNWESLRLAATERFGYYSPLTWMSYIIECTVYPVAAPPSIFHLTNIWLHVANAFLVFKIGRSFFTGCLTPMILAILFAMHPMQVESVAWIAERRGLLAAFFALLAFHLYCKQCSNRVKGGEVKVLLAYFCSVMAKPSCLLLPLLFPVARRGVRNRSLGRIQLSSDFIWFGLMVAVLVFHMMMQDRTLSASDGVPHLSVFRAAGGCLLYILKFLVPLQLLIPYEPYAWGSIEGFFAVLLLSASTLGIYLLSKESREVLWMGWMWFLTLLLPMSGMVAIARHGLANRYLYLPMVGLLFAGGGLLPSLQRHSWRVPFYWVGLVCLVVIYFAVAWKEVGHWRNTERLFGYTLSVDEHNMLAREYLYREALRQGDLKKAQEYATSRKPLANGPHEISLWGAYFVRVPEGTK